MRLSAKAAFIAVMSLLLAACASGPKFDAQGVDKTLTPQRAVTEIETQREARVIWGGIILSSGNLKESTQIEVLGYPLDNSFRPDINATPTGRFFVVKQAYLETADFVTGRLISVSGVLRRTHTGQIGEAAYTYPVMEPTDIYLWPRDGREPQSNVHFGFGVSIIR